MTQTPESPPVPADRKTPLARSPEQAAKAARLASALRENLRRRKAAHRPAAKPGN